MNTGSCWGILIGCHTMNEAVHHKEARTMTSSDKNYGLPQPQCSHLHKTMGLRVMEVQCQLPPQYPQGLIDQGPPGVRTVTNTTGSPQATWKSIYPSSRMRTRRILSPTKVWCWDIMVYHQEGCQNYSILPYISCSLQGYPGELVRSSGTNITLEGMITVLDEHYNNVKALDALNQDLFQSQMADKEMVSDWGVHLLSHLQILAASFPDRFLPDQFAELK